MLSRLVKPRTALACLGGALLLAWCVGMFARGYWTPDEPREADLSWRMSWQADKSVPLLAGEAYCEKPPLTYWLAAIPIKLLGKDAWAARLPNLLYALITAIGVGLLAARSTGRFAGLVGAAAVSSFLLSYQVAIWLATDAPLLACVSVALLGTYIGFYARSRPERLRGYLLMHAALGLGFLCKSAAAWMVPALVILTLCIWERRFKELLRWELYLGLLLQAALILTWVWFVYAGADGVAHLKVFFWNNLVGRFVAVDAPPELQYAAAHRNYPGKYLLELPMYLFPWTLLVIAAARRAWQQRHRPFHDQRAVRFAIAASLPPLLILSISATARNIYLAPALPGVALLLAWWAQEVSRGPERWEVRAMRATSALLLFSVVTVAAASLLIGGRGIYIGVAVLGLLGAAALAVRAWRDAPSHTASAQAALLLGFCALLIGPAPLIYRQVDRWQDLASLSRAIQVYAADRPLTLVAPDETTRAIIDMYARDSVINFPGPMDTAAALRLRASAVAAPNSLFLLQLPANSVELLPWRKRLPDNERLAAWIQTADLHMAQSFSLANGRRYALLQFKP
jgi:4-amino-4-deoxy-L-arabinose transferase-like glycosyltransferase